jgi:hypothetical protein
LAVVRDLVCGGRSCDGKECVLLSPSSSFSLAEHFPFSLPAIDLCNNPHTKEEKLKRAKRLIPEWTVYDDEVAALARRVESSSFSAKAEELGQAVEQKKEREEEEEKHAPAAASGDNRIKDEL